MRVGTAKFRSYPPGKSRDSVVRIFISFGEMAVIAGYLSLLPSVRLPKLESSF